MQSPSGRSHDARFNRWAMPVSAKTARQLLDQASQARSENRPMDALRNCNEAVVAARLSGDIDVLIAALRMLGQAERDLDQPVRALVPYKEAVALCRTTGTKLRLAQVVRHLGDLFLELKCPAEAAVEFSEALEIYRGEPGVRALDLANSLRGGALARELLGEPQFAIALWKEARAIYVELGIDPGVAECDEHLPFSSGRLDIT
jgi:tetratricopeptide (TPR) repeat protein